MPLHPQAQDQLDTLTSAPTPLNQMPPAVARSGSAGRIHLLGRHYPRLLPLW